VAKAVERYDHGVTKTKPKPEPVRKRVAHARAYAQAQESQRQLNLLVESEIAAAHVGSVSPEAVWLRLYARKLWRLLSRNRSKDEHKLKPKLEKLERWAAEVGIGSHPTLALLRERIAALSEMPESATKERGTTD